MNCFIPAHMFSWRNLFWVLLSTLLFQGCGIQYGSEIHWSSESQILMSESSQVRLRAVQSRVIESTDRTKILRAAVATMQDLFFDIDVLDEDLGVVSGKKLYNEKDPWADNPTYYFYQTDELILFNTNFRTWGPFNYRNNLARLTVTVRPKETTRSLVRASLQYNMRAVEDPDIYQSFFKSLNNALFMESVDQ